MQCNLRIQLLSITLYFVHDYVFMGRVLSTKFTNISPYSYGSYGIANANVSTHYSIDN